MSTTTATQTTAKNTAPAQARAAAPVMPVHPMDSSRILLAMTMLARTAAAHQGKDDIESIVSKPVLKTLLSALNYRDPQVLGHVRRVAMLAVGMAQQLGWEGRSLRILEAAALLHDIGKVGIADSILKKPSKLSADEAEYIARHHRIACNLLQAFRVDPEVIEIIAQSHQYVNGSLDGTGRVGKEMALGARILAVADAYDSLNNEQAFRAAKPHKECMAVLQSGSGSRFDGNVVAALERWANGEGLQFIMDRADVSMALNDSGVTSRAAVSEAGMLCHIFSYLNALETLYAGFYVLDSDMRFVVWSAGAEKLTGRTTAEVLGQQYHRGLVAHADVNGKEFEDDECAIRLATTSGKATCREVKVRHLDGSWRSIETQSIPLFDDKGGLQGVAQFFSDQDAGAAASHYRELKVAATRDPLTGIPNRAEMDKQVKQLFDRFWSTNPARRDDDRFSVIFADVDHFKSLNDTYGHAFGDRVLIDFANTLYEETFNGEMVARYGGEEFVILVPERRLDATAELAERLRQTVARLRWEDEPKVHITCSFGVAEVHDDDTPESLFARADAAVFEAKRTGRNRVEKEAKEEEVVVEVQKAELEYVQHFEACTQSDLIVMKLSGFVEEEGADLREVSEQRVVMRLGKAGWFGRWGKQPEEQPIEMAVEVGSLREGRGAAKYVPISATVVPVGRPPKHDVFEYRARKIVEMLRAHLVAR